MAFIHPSMLSYYIFYICFCVNSPIQEKVVLIIIGILVWSSWRIIVKDIPEYVRPDRLRELFSRKGEIIDVKLMHNIRFSLFAFIEFGTDHEAQEAVQCFNRTYIDTSMITFINKVSIDQGSKTLKQPIDEESKVVEVPFMRPDTVKKQLKSGKNVPLSFGPTVC
ncbi:RNA recognition motif [Medicago truncatula]|uniref:RNA recognition motif n=1 Tax=Medicago truncatula TaxID=3880 RepID=A0A072U3G9_MEDTR|nr:RNA recognition motif [Medicago truncatula]